MAKLNEYLKRLVGSKHPDNNELPPNEDYNYNYKILLEAKIKHKTKTLFKWRYNADRWAWVLKIDYPVNSWESEVLYTNIPSNAQPTELLDFTQERYDASREQLRFWDGSIFSGKWVSYEEILSKKGRTIF